MAMLLKRLPLRSAAAAAIESRFFLRPAVPLIPIRKYRSDRSPDDLPFSKYEQQRLPINWGVLIVQEKEVYVVERLGKYHRTLDSGIHFLIPFVDRIAGVHSLREMVIPISCPSAITRDYVSILLDGAVSVKIIDPILASYRMKNPINTLIRLAEEITISELQKITFDKMFEERDALNEKIMRAINEVASDWGLKCLHFDISFDIGDISPPPEVMQAGIESRKRAQVLESEGEAEAILNTAKAIAQSLEILSQTINAQGGAEETRQRVLEQCVQAMVHTAKAGTYKTKF
ncbi:stomatin-like protein 2, mitochondrial [Zingiber officinale]|uniref:stomatin-like protein 2, mitochondrial n=1 Tax=Zingiber officinale TaxID=94328 RepID=UPI001C4BB3FF|nr:stomatin-like protein 2, mitochondrial [Zingiber officinale]